MAYKDKFGVTEIKKGRRHNLSISWDYEDDATDKTQRRPVFLHTEDMKNTDDHDHIELTREEAQVLRDWLTDYLEDTK